MTVNARTTPAASGPGAAGDPGGTVPVSGGDFDGVVAGRPGRPTDHSPAVAVAGWRSTSACDKATRSGHLSSTVSGPADETVHRQP